MTEAASASSADADGRYVCECGAPEAGVHVADVGCAAVQGAATVDASGEGHIPAATGDADGGNGGRSRRCGPDDANGSGAGAPLQATEASTWSGS